MNLEKITKMGGMFIIFYVILLFVYSVLWYTLLPHKEEVENFAMMVSSQYWKVPYYFGILGVLFGLLGTIGILVKLSKFALALWATYTIIVSFMLQICIMSWEFLIWPIVVDDSSSIHLIAQSVINTNTSIISVYALFTLFFSVGNILLGISILKQKKNLNWAAIFLIVGAPVYVVGLAISGIVASIGMYAYLAGMFMIGITLLKTPLNQNELINH